MASSLALRRGATTAVFNRLVNPIRSVSAATRSFSADAEGTRYGGDGSVDVQHRPGSSSVARRADDDERSLDVDRRGGGTGRAVSRRRDPITSLFSGSRNLFLVLFFYFIYVIQVSSSELNLCMHSLEISW